MVQADSKLFYSCCALIAVGVVFSLSLPAFGVLFYDYNHWHFFIRQLAVGCVGLLAMWGISQLNPDKKLFWGLSVFEVMGFLLLFGSFGLMVAMQFMPSSLVPLTGGARRWIRLGGLSLSPVEFFKIGFIFFLAWSFARRIDSDKKRIRDEFLLLLPYFVIFGISVIFIAVMQKDLGQAVVLGVSLLILATFAGTSKRLFMLILVLAAVAVFFAIISQEHRINRFKGWWVMNQDIVLGIMPGWLGEFLRVSGSGEPYQIGHALNAINNGGFWGVGLGNGSFKLGFLSEVHTDFVLAGIAEEIGFIGVAGVSALFIFMVYRIFKISSRSAKKTYHLFSLGVGLVISLAFIINAYGVVSITPIKGIAVPFLSYGGSSVLALCVGVGMVLMVSKKASLE